MSNTPHKEPHTHEFHVLIIHTNSHTLINYMSSPYTQTVTLMNHTYTFMNYMYASHTQTATHS